MPTIDVEIAARSCPPFKGMYIRVAFPRPSRTSSPGRPPLDIGLTGRTARDG
jgi:hypothetical protein